MPTSLTPASRPADDEIECGNCGAYIYHDLVKCPNCGVYLDEPNETDEQRPKLRAKSKFALAVDSVLGSCAERRIQQKIYLWAY